MACVHTDPPESLECVQELDAAGTTEVESGARSSEEESPEKSREGLKIKTAMASDSPQLDVGALGAHSPRTRVGKRLETIGDMTVDTLQRITTVVGGVVKSPVSLMAKVGGLASPRTSFQSSPTSSPRTAPLEERVLHLEIQMKNLEEKFNSRTVVTELNLSPRSHSTLLPQSKEKPRTARSLLQEMETEGTLVKRVQMLEDRLNERMESIEKALSSIQSQLAHVDCSKCKAAESLAVYQRQESPSGEEYHDAEQQSDNFEALETLEQKALEENGAPSEATGASPAPRENGVESETPVEASGAAPTTEPVESVQKLDAGKSDDVFVSLESQSASTWVESKEPLVKEPMEAAPSVEPAESVQGDDGGNGAASSERQLASTLQELHEAFVTEPSAAAASARFSEITAARDPPLTSKVEEPQNGTVGSTEESLSSEEFHNRNQESGNLEPVESLDQKSLAEVGVPANAPGDATATSPALRETLVKESSTAAPTTEPVESVQGHDAGKSDGVFVSLEPQSAPASVESKEALVKQPLEAVPSVEPAESVQGVDGGNGEPASSERQLASTLEELHEAFVTEPSAAAANARFSEIAQADPAEKISVAVGSSEPQSASAPEESLEVAVPSVNFEEPAQEDAADKSGTMIAAAKSSLPPTFAEPQEDFVKEPLAAASSAEPAQERATQEDPGGNSDMALASSEPQVASKFVEEELAAAVPSVNFEESAQEDSADKSGTMVAAAKPSLPPTFEEPQEDFVKEPLAAAEPAQERETQEDPGGNSDMALASSEPQVASKFVEEPAAAVPSASFEEPAQEDAADKSGIMIATAESPLEETQENSVKESLAASAKFLEPSQESDSGNNAVAAASLETELASNSEEPAPEALAEEPSGTSVKLEESAQENAAEKSGTVLPAAESPLTSTVEESQNGTVGSVEEGKHVQKEAEYKLAEDAKAPAEHMKSIEEAFPRSPSDLAHVDSDELKPESLAAQHTVERQDSEQSGEEFYDADQGSGNFEPSESVEKESFEESVVGPDEPDEASEISPIAQKSFVKESLVPAPSAEPAQEPEQEPAQEDPAGKSGMTLVFEEPQAVSKFVEPQESFAEEPLVAVPSAKFEEPAQEPERQSEQQPAQDSEQQSEQEPAQKPERQSEQLEQKPAQEPEQEPAQENSAGKSGMALAFAEPQAASKFVEPQDSIVEEPLAAVPSAKFEELAQEPEQQPGQESAKEDPAEKSGMALASSEPQVASKFVEPLELPAEEPLAAVPSAKFEEPVENVADESGTRHVAARDSPLTSKVEESQNGTVGSTEESLSSEEFHDTNQESGILEPVETFEQKSLADVSVPANAPGDAADAPGEASGTSSTPQEASGKEPLTATPTTEPGESDNVYVSLEPQLASTLEESKEVFVNEPMEAAPNSEPTELAQGGIDGQSGTVLAYSEPQLTPELQEPQEALVKEPSAAAKLEEPVGKSGMPLASPESSKSVELQEPLAEESSVATPIAKLEELAQERVSDERSTGLAAAESPLTSIVEEPHNGSVSSVLEGKHGQNEADHKSTEDVKLPAGSVESIEEAFPRSQSDLAHANSYKLEPEAAQEPKEALEKEPSAAAAMAKLSELTEVEDVGKTGTELAAAEASPKGSTVEEPQKSLVQEPLAAVSSAKLLEPAQGDHARKRRFSRSVSEPQFVFKPEEARKALAKESSAAASRFEEHVQEDTVDMQCLPFRILGEGKNARKEIEFKSAEDVKSPAEKPEAAASYVLEPKPSKIKEKKKKDKKDRRQDEAGEEKERRNSLRMEEKDRKNSLRLEEKDRTNSLRVEEKDSKDSLRAEEKHKQPFKQWRNRLRHAFSVHKDP